MYSAWEEGRQLVEWMREYNASHGNVLQYFGTDIGGFYQNWKFPFENIFKYLKLVDVEYYEILNKKLEPFIELLAINARMNYSEKLSPTKKNELAVILNEALKQFDEQEEVYTSSSSSEEFQWARQGLASLQLAENYYRNYEERQQPGTSRYVGLNGREIAMARNCRWVKEKMRKDAKIIWINHVIHTKTKTQYQDEVWGHLTPAGQILQQIFGDQFFSIGMAYGGGQFWNRWQKPEERHVDSVPACGEGGSLERTLQQVCAGRNCLLPWSRVPDRSAAEAWTRTTLSLRENDYFIRLEPCEWDCCIYLDRVKPATPASN